MLQSLAELEQFLASNHMYDTLRSLRTQILSKIPTKPSNQYYTLVQQESKSIKNTQSIKKTPKNTNKKQEDAIIEALLSRIAYSSKLLDDNLNKKILKLKDNKIFIKTSQKMFPKLTESQIHQYQDQLQFAVSPQVQNQSFQRDIHNQISIIDIASDESSIISQPSYMMAELNNYISEDTYNDDNDLGYYQYTFHEDELQNGCAQITQKYGYPNCAVNKSFKAPKKAEKIPKFNNTINFPQAQSLNYPLEFNGVVYDCMQIKVIYDRQKTGYEEDWQSDIKEGDIIAGRFKVEGLLGCGVFAKVMKVSNQLTNELSCLKMITNHKDTTSKDFFDQALDEIKILRYIKANCNPDEHFLINFKSTFYHRQHLFLQTDLLKDNLFYAYRKNPGFFSLSTIKIISTQIIEAVRALHKLHIIHADLKPQNILIKSYHPVEIKVVDMGNSCYFHDHLGQYVQSRSYRAPEVVLGVQYDCKIDIWSIGCILAQLWTKNVLFYNMHIQGMLARIQGILGPWPQWMLQKGQLVPSYFSKENLIFLEDGNKMNILVPKKTSLSNRIRTHDQQFLSFLSLLLQVDPSKRPSAQDALSHPFLN